MGKGLLNVLSPISSTGLQGSSDYNGPTLVTASTAGWQEDQASFSQEQHLGVSGTLDDRRLWPHHPFH